MLPVLIHEDLTCQFCFFSQEKIHTGLAIKSGLYRLHQSYRWHKRLDAFTSAIELRRQGINTVVTVSTNENFYRIWTDLRVGLSAELYPLCSSIMESSKLILGSREKELINQQ